jgi:predicted amidohydrolase
LKVGIMICFDRQLPEPARQLALGGADLICCPSYGGRGPWNTRIMQVRAYENQVGVVFTHPEESLIIDRNGELVKEGAKDAYVIEDIPLAKPKKVRESIIRRRPETYRVLDSAK